LVTIPVQSESVAQEIQRLPLPPLVTWDVPLHGEASAQYLAVAKMFDLWQEAAVQKHRKGPASLPGHAAGVIDLYAQNVPARRPAPTSFQERFPQSDIILAPAIRLRCPANEKACPSVKQWSE